MNKKFQYLTIALSLFVMIPLHAMQNQWVVRPCTPEEIRAIEVANMKERTALVQKMHDDQCDKMGIPRIVVSDEKANQMYKEAIQKAVQEAFKVQ